MIPSSFDYIRAASVEEAVGLLKEHGDEAKLLAGGHSLVPAMKLRLSTPGVLIDMSGIEGLKGITEAEGQVRIGALTTHRMLEDSELVRAKAPLMAQAAAVIGDPQVRNRGTVGGSLAHADPAADYPAALLASGAQVVVQGPDGERVVEAGDFFVELFMTALEPEELVTEVRVPVLPADTGACYAKFPHPASRFAVVGCAAQVTVAGGVCTAVRVAFTGVDNAAFRDGGVEAALEGQGTDAVAAAAANAAADAEPLEDAFADAEYRRHLAAVYAKRALEGAVAAV